LNKLSNFPALYKFDAFRNQIDNISHFFDGAEKSVIEEIHLGRNRISSLPASFWECRFVLVDLKNNSITELSPSIGKLQQLVILDVAHNRLKHLPENYEVVKN